MSARLTPAAAAVRLDVDLIMINRFMERALVVGAAVGDADVLADLEEAARLLCGVAEATEKRAAS